jgi:hypothetical protein
MKRPVGVQKLDGKQVFFADHTRNRFYVLYIKVSDSIDNRREHSHLFIEATEVYKIKKTNQVPLDIPNLSPYTTHVEFHKKNGQTSTRSIKGKKETFHYTIEEECGLVIDWESKHVIYMNIDWTNQNIECKFPKIGDGAIGNTIKGGIFKPAEASSIPEFLRVIDNVIFANKELLLKELVDFQHATQVHVNKPVASPISVPVTNFGSLSLPQDLVNALSLAAAAGVKKPNDIDMKQYIKTVADILKANAKKYDNNPF